MAGWSFTPGLLKREKYTEMEKKAIGVIVPELKHPFFAEILDGIETVAFESGYALHVGQSKEDVKQEAVAIEQLIKSGIEGLLISIAQNSEDGKHFSALIPDKTPLVFFDRACKECRSSRVVVDDFEGAFKATEHLILSGYNPIAHLAGPRHLQCAINRLEGYKKALNEYDYPFEKEMVVYGDMDEASGIKGLKKLLNLKRRPEAVFAVNDPVAVGALKTIREAGLNIQDDIGLVGFSDNPMAALLHPPLTTVAQPRYEIGKRAAELLIERIENPDVNQSAKEVVLKTQLVIRQST